MPDEIELPAAHTLLYGFWQAERVSDEVFITENGDVGLGVPAPEERLSVKGNIAARRSAVKSNTDGEIFLISSPH